ncbi:putative Protein kinase domain containing protein [Blattamonas nauphoetae]|uniref:Protein kinase domain-containing protein n=1 Tax=Blattamonas nauphoetae TaxID=2049346 RepID=A0ABQ9Y4Q7_9EUKA|nr:putative Protein kinase domain containing protein [Blattamonas nauphoetae]
MKVLPFTSEEDFNKNEHEIAKLQNNQHENVVGFVDVIVEGNAHFVVLELCSCSLADRISESRKLGTTMDRVTVFRIVEDVLAGLGFLHSRNEVYGDLKPSNILIGCDGRAKLGDFGVVGVGTQKTHNSAECETMQFWAPEMFTVEGNETNGSQAGDMWAFGLIVLELLTGQEWISGTNAVEIAESVKAFDVQTLCQNAQVPPSVEPVLCLLLSKNPQDRLHSAELIQSGRLMRILGDEASLSQFVHEELDTAKKTIDQLQTKLSESERKVIKLENEKEGLRQDLVRETQKGIETRLKTKSVVKDTFLNSIYATDPNPNGQFLQAIRQYSTTFVPNFPRHPHSAQHFLLPTSLPSAEKSSVLPPITGCEERSEIKLGRQFPQQLTGQTHESSFRSRLCRAEYDWRLVNVFGHVATAYYEDLKTRDEPAFRANNNKKVVLCGHSTDDIITYRFLTSSVVGASTISTLTQDCACLHWMIPNKNTFDDDCVVVRLKILSPPPLQHILPSPTLPLSHLSACKGDNVCKIFMKNMTWTDNKAGKACVKTAVQRTRNNTDQPLVLPKVMTHVMYSIGINATAGVILNATSQRWSSDTHSDYYMDGDGTVPTVSLSSILQDAVPIARILDIIAQATAEEMEYDDSLNPPDIFLASHRILILRHEGRSILILRVILHLLMDNTSNQSESQNFYGTEDKIEDARIHPSHITTSHSITPECLSETKSCSWPSGPGQTSSLSTIDAATVEFEHQDSPNVAANQ